MRFDPRNIRDAAWLALGGLMVIYIEVLMDMFRPDIISHSFREAVEVLNVLAASFQLNLYIQLMRRLASKDYKHLYYGLWMGMAGSMVILFAMLLPLALLIPLPGLLELFASTIAILAMIPSVASGLMFMGCFLMYQDSIFSEKDPLRRSIAAGTIGYALATFQNLVTLHHHFSVIKQPLSQAVSGSHHLFIFFTSTVALISYVYFYSSFIRHDWSAVFDRHHPDNRPR